MSDPSYDVIDALRLVPLFYTIDWTPEKKAEWLRITGTTEATTKVMCDHIRSAIDIGETEAQLYAIQTKRGDLLENMIRDLTAVTSGLLDCIATTDPAVLLKVAKAQTTVARLTETFGV